MGIFDQPIRHREDRKFDGNHDGYLSPDERGDRARWNGYLQEQRRSAASSGDDDFDADELDDYQIDELDKAGIDAHDLEYMSEWERRDVIEDAGLDPDEYE